LTRGPAEIWVDWKLSIAGTLGGDALPICDIVFACKNSYWIRSNTLISTSLLIFGLIFWN
jgi:hypothetical protein